MALKQLYTAEPGVKFNVHAVHELPTSAKSDDIYLVFDEGVSLPDVSNIKALAVLDNFDIALGNIYPDNTVILFYKDNGTIGTNKLHYETKNLSLDIPISSTVAIVNHDGQQVKCSVQTYDTETGQWQESAYVQLPVTLAETLDFTAFFGTYTAPDLMAQLGLQDSVETLTDFENYAETLNFATFFGTHTAPDLIALLNLTETATYRTGGEPIPIT